MFVYKRDGRKQDVDYNKITTRIRYMIKDPITDYKIQDLNKIDPAKIAQEVIGVMKSGMTTSELDSLAAVYCASRNMEDPEYGKLASRIAIDDHQKNSVKTFAECCDILYNNKNKTGEHSPLVSEELYILSKKEEYNKIVEPKRDFLIDYFGFKTLCRSYLIKSQDKIVETPQYMWLRVSLGIHGDNYEKVKETYDLMSQKYFTHATPTLFNSGTMFPQLASCFLQATEDSLEGIFKTITDCARISKWAGGIGVHISNIRGKGAYIKSTGGRSDGIVPMLRTYNQVARYINQCFTPDTIIYTNKGSLPIEKIKPGYMVVTNDGSYKRINQVIKNEVDKEICQINIKDCYEPIKCTGVHEIMILRNGEKVFIPAEDVTTGDFMCFPMPIEYEENDIGAYCELFCKFYGVIMASGINTDPTGNVISIIIVSRIQENSKIVEEYANKCNIKYKIMEKTLEGFRTYQFNKGDFNKAMFFQNNKKFIIPDILNLPERKIKLIVINYLKNSHFRTKDHIKFVTTSHQLAHNLRFLLLRLGYLTSGKCEGDFVTISIPKYDTLCEELGVDDTDTVVYQKPKDGYLYSEVVSNETINYKGFVYDLNVQDNHNYLTQNGLVHNSGKRNGSFAIYMEPWHVDILDFLELKKPIGDENSRARDLFYALWIPDLFMEKMFHGNGDEDWYLMCPSECPGLNEVYGQEFNDLYNKYVNEGLFKKKVKIKEIWNSIINLQIETGTPYMLYKDACNKKSNQKNIGIIKSSNLCVTPDTKILTDKGYYKIGDLENQKVKVWNGEEWSDTMVIKTGSEQEIIKVELSNGSVLECTKYHKFYIETASRPANKSKPEQIEAQYLKEGMRIIKNEFPKIDNDRELKYPYKYGLLYADFYEVPINYSMNTKLRWLEGFMDGDGSVCKNGKNQSLQAGSIHKDFLVDIMYMLQTMGINSKVTFNTDGKGGSKLLINSFNTQKLVSLGFSPKRLDIKFHKPNRDASKFIVIKKVINEGKISDTYCFKEHKKGMGIFNGIITGQCSEIIEVSDQERTAVCNLGSIALPMFVRDNGYDFEKLMAITEILTENINKVIDLSFYPIPEAKFSNLESRPIGIGVQGLSDTFNKIRVPFDSPEAAKLNKQIFECIYFAALNKSCKLAQIDGPYPKFQGSPMSQGIFQFEMWEDYQLDPELSLDWEGLRERILQYGIRNSLLVALMPTASTSQILGNSECFEPITSNVFVRRTLAGEFQVMNRYMVDHLMELGLWCDDIRNRIIKNRGSLQDIEEIPREVRDLYKTSREIKQKVLIDMSADRGRFVDQSQSLNLFFEKADYARLTKAHYYGWKKGLKTGSYYIHGTPAATNDTFTECLNCSS